MIKDNVMYRFTTDKEAGEWDETVVEPTKMAVEVQALSAKMLIVESFDPATGTLVTRTADYQPEEETA